MYIELIDLLRCPNEHEDSWLVAAFHEMHGRFVVSGKLGCPVCSASYSIVDGVADFRAGAQVATAPGIGRSEEVTGADAETTIRFAAMLGLMRPDALVILEGESATVAPRLAELTDARVVALNPRAIPAETERLASVLASARLPLAPSSADGIVLAENADAIAAAEAHRILKPGARLVAPARLPLGPRFRELARDDDHVVAESVGPLVSLSR
ncbi:MAG: hypothetical protein Q7S20_13465 [Gemmatimonadaceae bacterium]|nr:hypothetical protein [Gemmatimonadaceae bacterium]